MSVVRGSAWRSTRSHLVLRTLLALLLVLSFGPSARAAQAWLTAHEDIGSPALAGSAWETSSGYTIRAAGTDIWGTSDQFHFVYRPVSDDGTITARVESLTNTHTWAKAGVMIRESLAADSRHAMAVMTPGNRMAFQWRPSTGGTTSTNDSGTFAGPYWVRLSARATPSRPIDRPTVRRGHSRAQRKRSQCHRPYMSGWR